MKFISPLVLLISAATAFAQADKDKSASLTKDELSGFLGGLA